MRKFKNFVLGGIQSKIFNLVVATIFMVIAAYAVVISLQNRYLSRAVEQTNAEQKVSIEHISTQVMERTVRRNLSKDTQMKAHIANGLFTQTEDQVVSLATYMSELYEYSSNAVATSVLSTPREEIAGLISAQVLYPDGTDIKTPEIYEEIRIFQSLMNVMKEQYEYTPASSIFVGTENGLWMILDENPESKVDAEGNLRYEDPRTRPWYIGAAKTGEIYYTDVEKDYFTDKVGIVCSVPVYREGKLVAVVGMDLFLEDMKEYVDNSSSEGRFSCVINEKGHVLFSPMSEGTFKVESVETAKDLRKTENQEFNDFLNKSMRESTEVQEITLDGIEYYISGAPLPEVGWVLVDLVEKSIVMSPTVKMQEQYEEIFDKALTSYSEVMGLTRYLIVLLILVVLLLGNVFGNILAGKIVKPLNSMAKDVSQMDGENLDFSVKSIYKTNDEIEALANSFEALTKRNKHYIEEIKTITSEKEQIRAELNVATQIQADMLPRIFPPFPDRKDFEIFASMDPAKEVGGDFYDFFLVDDDHLALVIADVSGKGVPAALFMVIAKTMIKNRTLMGGTPGEVMCDINDQLAEGNDAELFVTVWMAIVELSTGKVLSANAGHEHPALYRNGGDFELIKYMHGPAITLFPDVQFETRENKLNPGDCIFVYTDGVTDATNYESEQFGMKRLTESLNRSRGKHPADILKGVRQDIDEFVEDEQQFDDITMLCFEYKGPSGIVQNDGSENDNLI